MEFQSSITGMNVKLLAGCILLFQIGAILLSCKESGLSFCTLHESLYNPTESCSFPGAQSSAPIGLHKTDAASGWLFIKRSALEQKACREARYKINRTTEAVGVILAFTGKKMFYLN